ncbi:hypothetical protein Asppvi_003684 [Aspergillus pseudoviridinutans]|uniref:Uncharacterized protein n=1 Tax=Aspergillus pseudoviridinutans TaxID=1517512 RepID=A0A9P3ET99_9EURO|nr:uncharacterized protein Asppvi_003684 [Aspergillus pseudoviridinutans]GIJ84833.1 hypothetical protein Asppvi_003684 [Aspergillus pseudoviridinutans]
MSLTAPYNNAMRLGQGFNTYTQEIKIQNAVTIDPKAVTNGVESKQEAPVVLAVAAPKSEKPLVETKSETQSAPKEDGKTSSPGPEVNGVGSAPFSNAQLAEQAEDALLGKSDGDVELPFAMTNPPSPPSVQSVTYSTRAIDNVGKF